MTPLAPMCRNVQITAPLAQMCRNVQVTAPLAQMCRNVQEMKLKLVIYVFCSNTQNIVQYCVLASLYLYFSSSQRF